MTYREVLMVLNEKPNEQQLKAVARMFELNGGSVGPILDLLLFPVHKTVKGMINGEADLGGGRRVK